MLNTVACAPSSTTPCTRVTVALDPGHNPTPIDVDDPITGATMIDYSNGAEDADDFAVAQRVRRDLTASGYRVVLLKTSVEESVTYRQRVQRAQDAGAALALSIHTSVDDNAVFPQRVGLYREGTDTTGRWHRIVFGNERTAARSEAYSTQVAAARSRVQGVPVTLRDNSFDGRSPLWGGNIPIISLLADDVPWVYNEYGTPSGGGATPLTSADLDTYATGLVQGIRAALPVDENGCARA